MASKTMTLEAAICLAAKAHMGDVRKGENVPYIVHPLRVMTKVDTPEARMAAVLHDVVEDTEITFDDLAAQGCPKDVVEALKLLTHVKPGQDPGESRSDYLHRLDAEYLGYIEAMRHNPIARAVKLADLSDNIGDGTPYETGDPDHDEWCNRRLERYQTARRILGRQDTT